VNSTSTTEPSWSAPAQPPKLATKGEHVAFEVDGYDAGTALA
jgi:hypothetical protein